MSTRTELKKFGKGFGYAWQGLVYCVKTQRNFRFHMGAAFAVCWAGYICELSRGEWAVIMLDIGGVLALEAVNTAIEKAVDLSAKGEISPAAKAAKDCAAGAVLIFSLLAAIVGVRLFFLDGSFEKIERYFLNTPILIGAAAVYAVLWFVWVFVLFGKRDNKEQ